MLAGLLRMMSILPLWELTWLAHDQWVTTSRFLQTIASGPSSHLQPEDRRERRETIRSLSMRSDRPATGAPTLLVYERTTPHRLTTRSNRQWSRVISQLLAPSLDRKLAEGRAPETHLLLAARAQVLVSPVMRQTSRILLGRSPGTCPRGRPGPRDPRTPINRDSILASEPEIRALLGVLVAPTPGHVRGIAMLSRLLSDGRGPLYHHRGSDELRGVLLAGNCSSRFFSDVRQTSGPLRSGPAEAAVRWARSTKGSQRRHAGGIRRGRSATATVPERCDPRVQRLFPQPTKYADAAPDRSEGCPGRSRFRGSPPG